MSEPLPHIPTEVYLDFLGRSIEIHWNYHAILMFAIWMVLVPLCIISIRFFKPKPSEFGIRTKIGLKNIRWWWFNVHKYGLYLAIGLSLVGLLFAVVVSQGISGSVHSFFGLMTVIMGCLQVGSALLRGTHGGRYYNNADPDDPLDMARRPFRLHAAPAPVRGLSQNIRLLHRRFRDGGHRVRSHAVPDAGLVGADPDCSLPLSGDLDRSGVLGPSA